jgi:hypothetical protein
MAPHTPHIVFLFSDTGGGHRSAAEAIIGALKRAYLGEFTCEMVDIFRKFVPPPLNGSRTFTHPWRAGPIFIFTWAHPSA